MSQFESPKHQNDTRFFVNIPYDNKDSAKEIASMFFDKSRKLWYTKTAADKVKITHLEGELDCTSQTGKSVADVLSAAIDFLSGLGLEDVKGGPFIDGKKHRCKIIGKGAGNASGEYTLYDNDGFYAGFAKNHITKDSGKWSFSGNYSKTNKSSVTTSVKIAQRGWENAIDKIGSRLDAEEKANKIWDSLADNGVKEHPYLEKKGIALHGARINPKINCVVIPIKNAWGKIKSLQFINEDGEKKLLSGGGISGNFFQFGFIKKGQDIIFAEGFSTAATLYANIKKPVVAAIDCGNLEAVAKLLNEKYPDSRFVIAADNDHEHIRSYQRNGVKLSEPHNPGEEGAEKVKKLFNNSIVMSPEFTCGGEGDWNDLVSQEGEIELCRQFIGLYPELEAKQKQAQIKL